MKFALIAFFAVALLSAIAFAFPAVEVAENKLAVESIVGAAGTHDNVGERLARAKNYGNNHGHYGKQHGGHHGGGHHQGGHHGGYQGGHHSSGHHSGGHHSGGHHSGGYQGGHQKQHGHYGHSG